MRRGFVTRPTVTTDVSLSAVLNQVGTVQYLVVRLSPKDVHG